MNTNNLIIENWDKTSPVNGCEASRILKNNPEFNNSSCFLLKQNDQVLRIECEATIRANYGIDPEATSEDVYAAYLEQYLKENNPDSDLSSLELAIKQKLEALATFDTDESGNGINNFLINNLPAWIPADQRSIYRTSVESAELLGEETIELALAGMFIPLPVQDAKMMLAQLQRYADRAAIQTAKHRQAIEALTSVEEVEGYDFTTGYPEKVSFDMDTLQRKNITEI